MNTVTGNILLVSPHPDDEMIGACATEFNLKDAGYTIINLACSLGSPDQRERREAELESACGVAGFKIELPEDPTLLFTSSQPDKIEAHLGKKVAELFEKYHPDTVIMPSVHDNHPHHEVVARAARNSLADLNDARIWMYNVWGELPVPTLYSAFDDPMFDRIMESLEPYSVETDRNNYGNMVRGRALLGAVLGSEKVFGYGSEAASELPYAELLTEVVRSDGHWLKGQKRILAPDNVTVPPTDDSLDGWINSNSPGQLYGGQLIDPRFLPTD